jgi:DNA-binding HxlR family transcriptional regulator
MKPTFEEQGYIEKFEELSKNGKGLLIAKDWRAKEKYGLDDESFIWLTDEYRKDAVNPRKISDLKSKIEEFVEKNAKAVILLSNMEYLIKKNSLIEVWEFVKDLYGKISSKATMMISANLEKMDEEMAKEIEDLMSDIRLGSISNSISNYLRRRIISSLSNGKREFTKIARSLGIKDHPKLSFHLKKLKEDGIIQQDEDKKYLLTKTGEDVAKILDEMKRHGVGKEKNLIWIPVKRVKS